MAEGHFAAWRLATLARRRAITALSGEVRPGTREVQILGVTEHANENFMVQVARNLTMEQTGWLKQVGCRYLIHDRDKKYCDAWRGVFHRADIEVVPTPPQSPNLNAFAERWVRTVKRECVRRCWFLGYAGLCRTLNEFVAHYKSASYCAFRACA
jgi:hypothetical protein